MKPVVEVPAKKKSVAAKSVGKHEIKISLSLFVAVTDCHLFVLTR